MTTTEIAFVGYPPSLIYNNLVTISNDGSYAFVSGESVVNVTGSTPAASTTLNTTHSGSPVLSIACETLAGSSLAVYGHVVAVSRHDATELFFGNGYTCTVVSFDAVGADGSGSCCQLCLIGDTLHIMVGSPAGVVTFFEFSNTTVQSSTTGSSPSKKITAVKAHENREVTALSLLAPATDSSVLAASGDIGGNVVLWSRNRTPVLTLPPADKTECVSALALLTLPNSPTETMVAVGLGHGLVRLYTSAGTLRMEICAHAKWINAMVWSKQRNMLATASEDGCVSLFVLPTSIVDGDAKQHASVFFADKLPTGLSFSAQESQLAVSFYDTRALTVITL